MKIKTAMDQDHIDLQIEMNEAYLALRELKAYLLSPKFHEDKTVQTSDVLRRLEEVNLTYDETVAKWSAIAAESDKAQIKEAIERGESFTVYGRPVKIYNDNLVVEVNTGKGKAFAHFTNEDIPNIQNEQ